MDDEDEEVVLVLRERGLGRSLSQRARDWLLLGGKVGWMDGERREGGATNPVFFLGSHDFSQ